MWLGVPVRKVHWSSQVGGYFSSVCTGDVHLDSRERRERGKKKKSRIQIHDSDEGSSVLLLFNCKGHVCQNLCSCWIKIFLTQEKNKNTKLNPELRTITTTAEISSVRKILLKCWRAPMSLLLFSFFILSQCRWVGSDNSNNKNN